MEPGKFPPAFKRLPPCPGGQSAIARIAEAGKQIIGLHNEGAAFRGR